MSLENLKFELHPSLGNHRDPINNRYYPKKNDRDQKITFLANREEKLKPNERRIFDLKLRAQVDENHLLHLTSNYEFASRNGAFIVDRYITHRNRDWLYITLWNTTNTVFIIKPDDILCEGYLLHAPHLYSIEIVKKIEV